MDKRIKHPIKAPKRSAASQQATMKKALRSGNPTGRNSKSVRISEPTRIPSKENILMVKSKFAQNKKTQRENDAVKKKAGKNNRSRFSGLPYPGSILLIEEPFAYLE